MKKLSIMLLTGLMMLALSSCNRFDLDLELIDQNILNAPTDSISQIESIHQIDLSTYDAVTYFYQLGLALVNTGLEYGVYSLTENRLIIDLMERFIMIEPNAIMGAYIYVYDMNEVEVYDSLGIKIIEKNHYADYRISPRIIELYENGVARLTYIEIISTLTVEAYDLGERANQIKAYKINLNNGARTEIPLELITYQEGERWNEDFTNKIDLELFGLKGYYALIVGSTMRIYDASTKQLINSFNLPQVSQSQVAYFDGSLVYQVVMPLPDTENSYDYVVGGIKYRLKTYAIDLLTGETNTLKFNYRIDTLNPFKEDDIYQYGLASVYEIHDNVLHTERTYQLIMNKKGDILSDVTGLGFSSLVRLNDTRIYDSATRTIVDNDLKPIVELPQLHTFIYREALIVFRHNEFYGAINYNGEVVIPFIYETLSPSFYNGYTFGNHHNTETYIININQTPIQTVKLEGMIRYITPGLYASFINNEMGSSYLYTVYLNGYEDGLNYGEVQTNNYTHSTFVVNSPYGNYTVLRFNSSAPFHHFVIKQN
ncbi:WG repeat-containing protein [Liberiplasma polymorphum]|uniref:WG repeat-containing protein n=1 Tax=Liberiplasma polymorphum TaxID=3374570 RepID=UPI0037721591